MAMRINDVIPLKCTETSFFRAWMEMLTPIHKLTAREKDVAARSSAQRQASKPAIRFFMAIPPLKAVLRLYDSFHNRRFFLFRQLVFVPGRACGGLAAGFGAPGRAARPPFPSRIPIPAQENPGLADRGSWIP